MPAPWNESCLGEHLSFGSFAIPLAQNLSHRSHAIPLGFTSWNSFSACLLAKNDRIGRARPDLVNQGHVNPLGLEVHRESGGFVPWNACPACLLAKNDRIGGDRLSLLNRADVIALGLTPLNARYSNGALSFSKGFYTKLHQLRKNVEFFL